MSQPVEVVGPAGERGTVDAADVANMAEGWRPASAAELHAEAQQDQFGGAAGQALAAIAGASRAASFGISDAAAAGTMGLLMGEDARKEVLRTFKTAKEANPGATLAGEFGGLMAGGVGALGNATEAKVGGLLGEGLLGRMGTGALRMGVETGAMGAQQQLTEDVLGDHALNGQAIFSILGKAGQDALLGAGVGAAFGAGGYALDGILGRLRGPMGSTTADAVAGVEGAGKGLADNARAREALIEDLRKGGATSEQAAKVADDVEALSQAKGKVAETTTGDAAADAASKDFTQKATDYYADMVGGKGSTKAEDLKKTFGEYSKRLAEQEDRVNAAAADFTKRLTGSLRNVEDIANEAAFTQKPSMVRRLVDPSKLDAQADQVASLLQEADGTLDFWNETATKGGAPGPVKALRNSISDLRKSLAGFTADTPSASADLFLKTDALKRSFDHYMKWGLESRYGLPPAIKGILDTATGETKYSLEALTNKMRASLEDTSVWGDVADAQAKGNAAFANLKARRDHLTDQLGVAIDQVNGVRIREGDFTKVKSFLGQMSGDATDAEHQTVKSLEAYLDGMRVRADVAKQFGQLSPAEVAKLDRGLEDLTELRKSFDTARADAAAVNRIKKAQAEEVGHGVGGLLGLVTDAVTRPYTTMRRLGDVAHKIEQVKGGLSKGFARLTGDEAGSVAARVAPRPKADAVAEMTQVRELAANPVALESRLERMTGSMKNYAPQIAEEVKNTARRAIYYLAKEAPPGTTRTGLSASPKSTPRFSDQQVSEWENKRKAALGAVNGTSAPDTIIADMKMGRLNRDAIQTIEFVSPQLFGHMQELARDQLDKMAARGELDSMPYQTRAAISTLLKVPADGTWKPDFIAMIQAAKAPPPPPQAAPGPQQQTSGRKADKPTASMWMDKAATVEAGGVM